MNGLGIVLIACLIAGVYAIAVLTAAARTKRDRASGTSEGNAYSEMNDELHTGHAGEETMLRKAG